MSSCESLSHATLSNSQPSAALQEPSAALQKPSATLPKQKAQKVQKQVQTKALPVPKTPVAVDKGTMLFIPNVTEISDSREIFDTFEKEVRYTRRWGAETKTGALTDATGPAAFGR